MGRVQSIGHDSWRSSDSIRLI